MSEKNLEVSVVTPYRALFEGTATYVQVPLYDGLAGIQPGHAPMFARMGPGKLTVHVNNSTKILFIDGGFLEVSGQKVTVLAHNALAPEDIKVEDVLKEKDELLAGRVSGEDDIDHRLERLQSVRNRLTLVKK